MVAPVTTTLPLTELQLVSGRPRGVGSAADSERQTGDYALTPENWTSISIDLDELFVQGDARQVGQILLVNVLTQESFDNYYL